MSPAISSNDFLVVRQFPVSVNSGRPISATNHRTGFQAGNVGKLLAMVGLDVNGPSITCIRNGHPIVEKKPIQLFSRNLHLFYAPLKMVSPSYFHKKTNDHTIISTEH
jgi:hypothetical protein